MKHCLRVPRIFIPRGNMAAFSVVACDQFTSDRAYWERVRKKAGDISALDFILPEVYLGEEDEERAKAAHECMYRALEEDRLEKLVRGCVLTKRYLKAGVRQGILAAIDLEAYTSDYGVSSPIRSSEEVVPSRLPPRVAMRRGAILEFPHAVLFYKDKKNKIARILEDEDLEQLYDFELMEGGGRVTGHFIPQDLAEYVLDAMQTKGEPCLAVADGNHSVAAAKAYWEEIKPSLSLVDQLNHPARFMLVELENIYDEAVIFHPIHRILKGVDRETAIDFITSSVRCKREGALLYPALHAGGEGVKKIDDLLETYVRQNGGSIDYIHGEQELAALAKDENSVGIVLKAIEKDDFFDELKGGHNFPKKTFSLGEGKEKRYYLEGREISYD